MKPTLRCGVSRRIVKFDPIICADDVTAAKPAPEGLLTIQRRSPDAKLWYVGDTVDDARCARAAGVPFIGIAAQRTPSATN